MATAIVPREREERPDPARRKGIRVDVVRTVEEIDFDAWADRYVAALAKVSHRIRTP